MLVVLMIIAIFVAYRMGYNTGLDRGIDIFMVKYTGLTVEEAGPKVAKLLKENDHE